MMISPKIEDTRAAADEWLRKRLEIDELLLPDYERYTGKVTIQKVEKEKIPWFKYMLP